MSDDYVLSTYPGAKRIYPSGDLTQIKGNKGDFDLVYEYGEDPVKYIVVEAKGGAGKLGVKKIEKNKKMLTVEQDSADYFNADSGEYGVNMDHPDMLHPGELLVETDPDNILYLYVEVLAEHPGRREADWGAYL